MGCGAGCGAWGNRIKQEVVGGERMGMGIGMDWDEVGNGCGIGIGKLLLFIKHQKKWKIYKRFHLEHEYFEHKDSDSGELKSESVGAQAD